MLLDRRPRPEHVTAQEQEHYMTIGRISLYPMFLALSWMQDAATTLTTVDPCHQGGGKAPRRPCARRHYTILARRDHEPRSRRGTICSEL